MPASIAFRFAALSGVLLSGNCFQFTQLYERNPVKLIIYLLKNKSADLNPHSLMIYSVTVPVMSVVSESIVCCSLFNSLLTSDLKFS